MKKSSSKKIISFSILLFVLVFSFYAHGVLAQSAGIVPVKGKSDGSYGLNDFVQLGINVAQWILGISGSLALLFFIYGGFTFLISGGNSTQVDKGKKILSGAIIGLVLVFTSYMIIQFAMKAIGLQWSGTTSAPKIDTSVVK